VIPYGIIPSYLVVARVTNVTTYHGEVFEIPGPAFNVVASLGWAGLVEADGLEPSSPVVCFERTDPG
jgi:hypothetical protein